MKILKAPNRKKLRFGVVFAAPSSLELAKAAITAPLELESSSDRTLNRISVELQLAARRSCGRNGGVGVEMEKGVEVGMEMEERKKLMCYDYIFYFSFTLVFNLFYLFLYSYIHLIPCVERECCWWHFSQLK